MSRHLLFLTATSHKGDPANLRLLLDMPEPGYLTDDIESVNGQDNPDGGGGSAVAFAADGAY